MKQETHSQGDSSAHSERTSGTSGTSSAHNTESAESGTQAGAPEATATTDTTTVTPTSPSLSPDAPSPTAPDAPTTKRLSKKAKITLASVLAVIVIAATAITTVVVKNKSTWEANALSEKIEKIYTEDYQTQAAATVSEKKAADTYTADNMLVLENPYGTNTTSLYVYFTTDDATKVTYTVTAPDTDYADLPPLPIRRASTRRNTSSPFSASFPTLRTRSSSPSPPSPGNR